MTGFVAYIDESGCDGFDFDGGSSDFLVVAAIVMRRSKLDALTEAIFSARKDARKSSGWVFKTFKKLNTSESQRWLLASKFSEVPCRAIAVLVYKKALIAEGWKENKEDLYFHAAKFLVERISWACRDTNVKVPEENPICEVIFSQRGKMRYDKFQDYVSRLRDDPQRYVCKAEWDHIDPEFIRSEVHDDEHYGHLAADHFASAIGCAVELKNYGWFDDRYARIWTPKIYDFKGKKLGNGIKIWPTDGVDALQASSRGLWLKSL